MRKHLGKQVVRWINHKNQRNEALDTFVGCLAVRKALPARLEATLEYGVRPVAVAEAPEPFDPSDGLPAQPQAPAPFVRPAQPRGSSYLGHRPGGWLR